MASDVLFDDTYNGPRFTYGLKYRPLGMAQVPDGWIIFSDKEDKRFQFGTVDYPVKLADAVVKSFDLEFVAQAGQPTEAN